MSWLGLLSFDFDGTIFAEPSKKIRISEEFISTLGKLIDRGFAWGINTGREYEFLLEGLTAANIPHKPHFIVSREREVYYLDEERGWIEDQPWKQECVEKHEELFARENKAISTVKEFVLNETDAEWVSILGDPAGLIATSLEEMERILEVVHQEIEHIPDLAILRSTVYMRFTHAEFHKGTSLQHVARLLGVSRENTFAIGDGENDLGMLSYDYAGKVACPANADQVVLERVREIGGYIARQETSIGTKEALEYFFF